MKFKKLILIVVMLLSVFLLPGCETTGGTDKGQVVTGKYELDKVYIDGEISTTYYITYVIEFKSNYTCTIQIYGLAGL